MGDFFKKHIMVLFLAHSLKRPFAFAFKAKFCAAASTKIRVIDQPFRYNLGRDSAGRTMTFLSLALSALCCFAVSLCLRDQDATAAASLYFSATGNSQSLFWTSLKQLFLKNYKIIPLLKVILKPHVYELKISKKVK